MFCFSVFLRIKIFFLSAKQQKKMASYCLQIFGDMLLNKSLEDYPVSFFGQFIKFFKFLNCDKF